MNHELGIDPGSTSSNENRIYLENIAVLSPVIVLLSDPHGSLQIFSSQVEDRQGPGYFPKSKFTSEHK